MKIKMFMIISVLLFFGCDNLSAELNQFGISDIIPSHADDNVVFDQRIKEEMTNDSFALESRHTESFTIQDILRFIPRIKAAFESYLNHADNRNPDDLEFIKLAIIDVEKAKMMLKPQDVTPQEEHELRRVFDRLNTRIRAYTHSDNIEGDSYIR